MRGCLATFLVATLFLAVVAFLAVRLVAAPPPRAGAANASVSAPALKSTSVMMRSSLFIVCPFIK